MARLTAVLFVAFSVRLAAAASAQVFAPPSEGPLVQTANYTSFSNSTLKDKPTCKGKAFNRIIQIWLENTDFATTASTPIFESLAEQGILLTNYNAVTHPSEPNYVAAIGGDFFGMHDDNMYHIPSNISTVVDLLEDKHLSGTQLHLPTSKPYPYYVRKHNPLIIYDAISQDPQRVKRIRTFNDFANDVVNGTLPQSTTPTTPPSTLPPPSSSTGSSPCSPTARERRRDAHPADFDETETYTIQNNVFAVALGGAIPLTARDERRHMYTHYSTLSTVQANWGLKSLGRQDTNATVSNVLSFVAAKTGYHNVDVPASEMPEFNLTGVPPPSYPFAAPNLKAKGASGGPSSSAPASTRNSPPGPAAAVNMTALDRTTPWQMSARTTSGGSIVECEDAGCA
ncbi:hypothetical protein B0H13DRAFT_1896276 [Mycena leptocephala]|nr:hypothetical protein B0H13DRAFT_1896276 [Mycena leptocephala]